MDDEHCNRVPAVPINFLTLAQLQERWLQRKQREQEEEARLQRHKQEEEEEEERNQREKEERLQKLRIQHAQKRDNENRQRPRSNNVPRPLFHKDRRNQCPSGGAGDNEMKPNNTHIGEVVAEGAVPKNDDYMRRRTRSKKLESSSRNRRNQCPGVGTSDSEQKPEITHVGEVVAEGAESITGDYVRRRIRSKKMESFSRNRQNQCPGRGTSDSERRPEKTHVGKSKNPRARKEKHTDDLLPEKAVDTETMVVVAERKAGKDKIWEKEAWVGGSAELERKLGTLSVCGGGGEGFNGRPNGYKRGGHRNQDRGPGGFDWQMKRDSNLVWVKKGVDSDINTA